MKKLRGLYLALHYSCSILNENVEDLNGVEKKIASQIRTLKKNGINVSLLNSFSNVTDDLIHKSDFIYMRKSSFANFRMIHFFYRVKKINPSLKLIVEVPTYPYDSEIVQNKSANLVDRILHLEDKLYRKIFKFYINRIVTYSEDNSIFGVKTIRIVNAIDFKEVKREELLKSVPNQINMIAVASLDFWHGYDRAITGLNNFYKKHENPDFKLFIVGDGPEYERYKKMVKDFNLEKHVILTGFKGGNDLKKIYKSCVIGLDSMGRHRSGIFFNSSLKGKEYCANGLMIISGVKTDLDNVKNYKYYLRVPADESPINFEKVYKFYRDCLSKENISTIQSNIMRFAFEKFDYSVALMPVLNFIKDH